MRLRFDVACTARLDGCQLALEMAGQARIWLNGQPVPAIVTGWYVDKAIQTVALPRWNRRTRSMSNCLSAGAPTLNGATAG